MTATQGPICPACGSVLYGERSRTYCDNRCRQRAKRRRDLGLPVNLPRARGKNALRKLAGL